MSPTNLDVVRGYLAALQRFAAPDELAAFFTDDVVMNELPNRLVPSGRTRSRDELLSASTQAPKVLAEQRYVIRRELELGDTVALDVDWSATLKVPLSQTPAGGKLNARISMWARLRDGRICEQTNFDCYQPF
ncbi:MAG: nuclear transport factor 2 family protein [Archangium sp.]